MCTNYTEKMADTRNCVFCSLSSERLLHSNEHGFVVRDAYPISPGHTLIIAKRHVGSFFQLSAEERARLLSLLEHARLAIDREMRPAGYNVGINEGRAAGQTVPHLHIHLIPRYVGDQSDPRGGVRWIFPDKAKYWS
jgi:diadenosine tetraphosphate (Ap4A) HIT family hydrolase